MKYALSGELALLIVDVQRDFLPGGALPVPNGDQVIPVLNCYLSWFVSRQCPVFASRDWHPAAHCSFASQGGPWPVHCVRGTTGAAFAPGLRLPDDCRVISKAEQPDRDAYSAFSGTDLQAQLNALQIRSLAIGGLATEYCVKHSVLDALAMKFDVFLLIDAVRGIDGQPHDSDHAIGDMLSAGARSVLYEELAAGDPLDEC